MLTTIIRTFIIYFVVTLCVRLMGKRQLGELQPGELVITLLISEIATTPITDATLPVTNTVVALLLLVLLEIVSSLINRKSVRFRYITDGRPVTVIKNGKLHQRNLKRLRFTIDDILSALRQKDVFDINTVQHAVVETNGMLSVLLKDEHQPLTPKIINMTIEETNAPFHVIIDGRIIDETLKDCPMTKTEIDDIIKKRNITMKDILLLTIDKDKNYNLITKT